MRRTGAGALAGLMAVAALPLAASPAAASLAAVGPVSAANGYPTYFEDASGLRLRLCDDPADGCTMAEVPDPGAPVSFPGNYPGESFYFGAAAEVATGSYEAALEAAFTDGSAAVGENILFARIRVRMGNLEPNATYRVTHPYGVIDLLADAAGEIDHTDDQGCMAPPCGSFGAAVDGFVGDQAGTSMNFLTATTFNRATAVEGTPIGDPVNGTAVTGSPFGTNFLRVEGPDAGGEGIDVATSSTFTLEGQVAAAPSADRPSTPDLAAASDSGRASTDNITNVATPTFTGTATTGPVELLVDGAVAGTAQVVDGTYSVTPTAALAAGSRRIQVRTPDPASDPTAPTTLTSGTLTIQVDTTRPPATIDAPRPTNNTIDATPTFLFSSAEAGTTFECSLTPSTEGTVRAYESCVSPLTYDDQANGTYTFRVRATDPAGNVTEPATSYTWAIGPSDTTAPTVTGRAPGNGATNVAVTADVTATFSEPVQGVGRTTVVLTDPAGAAVPAEVTYAGASTTATLNPTASLAFGTRYTVTLTGNATSGIRDVSNNPLATTTWAFTTAAAPDTSAPTVTARSPQPDATGVAIGSNVTATFSEPVQGWSTTTATVRAGTSAPVASRVTYDATSRVLTVDPTADLAHSTAYTVTLTGGDTAIRDASGNPLATTTWSFRTAAAPSTTNPAPTVTPLAPADGATGVSRTNNITMRMSEAVQGVSSSTVTLHDTTTGAAMAGVVTYKPDTLGVILNPNATLAAGTRYTVTVTGGPSAIRDLAGAALVTRTWSFTTAGTSSTNTAPTVTTRSPNAGATGVARSTDVKATFSEAVQGVDGSSFTLRSSAGLAVTAVVTYDATTRVATLNPGADLAAGTSYTATLNGSSTAIKDSTGLSLATTSWSFTTATSTTTNTPPTLTMRSPGPGATGVSRINNLTMRFSEAVQGVGTSTVTLRNASTGALVTSAVTYKPDTWGVILNPGVTLSANTRYTIRVDGGANQIRDLAGAAFADTSWTFTTGS